MSRHEYGGYPDAGIRLAEKGMFFDREQEGPANVMPPSSFRQFLYAQPVHAQSSNPYTPNS
eukprot:5056825-Pyramimonas_sp.AAC.1